MADLTVLAEGLRFPEGPVAFGDGSTVLVEVARRRITHVASVGRRRLSPSRVVGPTVWRSGRTASSTSATTAAASPGTSRTDCSSPARTTPACTQVGASSGSTSTPGLSRCCTRSVKATRCGPRTTSSSTAPAASGSLTTAWWQNDPRIGVASTTPKRIARRSPRSSSRSTRRTASRYPRTAHGSTRPRLSRVGCGGGMSLRLARSCWCPGSWATAGHCCEASGVSGRSTASTRWRSMARAGRASPP